PHARRPQRGQQFPGALRHPPLLERQSRLREPAMGHLGRKSAQRATPRETIGRDRARQRRARQSRARRSREHTDPIAEHRGPQASEGKMIHWVIYAFCGFFVAGADSKLYNNASQVVLMRSGNHTVMTMSNNYKGPPENFAMVVPVPVVLKKEQVKTLPHDVFKHVDELSAPRLVEYWEEDPCPE